MRHTLTLQCLEFKFEQISLVFLFNFLHVGLGHVIYIYLCSIFSKYHCRRTLARALVVSPERRGPKGRWTTLQP